MNPIISFLTLALLIFTIAPLVGADEVPTAEFKTVTVNPRLLTLQDFPDGLHTGARDIHIYLPANYNASKETYPVFYFHDGWQVFSGSTKTLEELTQADITYDKLVEQNLFIRRFWLALRQAAPNAVAVAAKT